MILDRSNTTRYLAQFGSALLQTKMCERSNSVRHRLWKALSNTCARHREDIPERGFVFDLLRETGGFDNEEVRFRRSVRDILVCISRAPKVVEIAQTLFQFAQDARDERIFELAADAMSRQVERQKLLNLSGDFLRHEESLDRKRRQIHRELLARI